MKKYRVLYLTYEDVFAIGILQAQVVKPLLEVEKKYEADITLVSCVKEKDRNKRVYKENKEDFVRKSSKMKVLEMKKKLNDKQSIILYAYDMLSYFFKVLPSAFKTDVIHVRSYGPALFGLIFSKVFRKKLIFDMRGVLPEEIVLLGKANVHSLKIRILKYVEKLVINQADSVFVVSQPFEDYIKANFKPRDVYNISNPTFFSDYTPSVKQWDKIRVTYSGSAMPWHATDSTYRYIKDLLNFFEDKVEVVICSNNKEYHEACCDKHGIDKGKIEIISLAHHDMPDLLETCHLGFCLTNKSFVTEVCCPVKFAEYIGSEISVITNHGVGDISQYVLDRKCGLVFDSPDYCKSNSKKLIEYLKSMYIDQATPWSRETCLDFDWSNRVDHLHQKYKNLVFGE